MNKTTNVQRSFIKSIRLIEKDITSALISPAGEDNGKEGEGKMSLVPIQYSSIQLPSTSVFMGLSLSHSWKTMIQTDGSCVYGVQCDTFLVIES